MMRAAAVLILVVLLVPGGTAWADTPSPEPVLVGGSLTPFPNDMGGSWYFSDGRAFARDFQIWEHNQQQFSKGLNSQSSLRAWSEFFQQPPAKMLEAFRLGRDGARSYGLGRIPLDPAMGPDGQPVQGSNLSRMGTAVGAVLAYTAPLLIDKLFGAITYYHQDGSVCSEGLCAPGVRHFSHRGPGFFHEENWEGHEYLMPGFSWESTASSGFVFERVVSADPAVVSFFQGTDIVGGYPYYAWTTDCHTLWVDLQTMFRNPDHPIRPAGSIVPTVTNFHTVGLLNEATGAVYQPSRLAVTNSQYTNGQWMATMLTSSASTADSWAQQYRAWISTSMGSPLIQPKPAEQEEQDGLGVPMPAPSALPSGGTWDEDLTVDDSVAEWLDSYDAPSSVPQPVQDATGSDPGADHWKATVGPAVTGLVNTAGARWPFAGYTVLRSVWSRDAASSDPVEWSVQFNPFAGGASPEVRVPVTPLAWIEPFRPWRWVGVAGVALGFIAALFVLLRPKVSI